MYTIESSPRPGLLTAIAVQHELGKLKNEMGLHMGGPGCSFERLLASNIYLYLRSLPYSTSIIQGFADKGTISTSFPDENFSSRLLFIELFITAFKNIESSIWGPLLTRLPMPLYILLMDSSCTWIESPFLAEGLRLRKVSTLTYIAGYLVFTSHGVYETRPKANICLVTGHRPVRANWKSFRSPRLLGGQDFLLPRQTPTLLPFCRNSIH
jgi:hypothetical protein